MANAIYVKRLTRELRDLQQNAPVGVTVEEADDFVRWRLRIQGAPKTLYEGEEFKLEFRFTPSYPMEAPEVLFVKPYIPVHPQIYSNGHICINILYKDWSPVQTVSQVCLSIQSMLSSCRKKELPPDNDLYIKSASASPKKTAWAFHDETV
ncbi:ubiquitin-conjugating enzyme/RWD-like protein [Radiomyces spectabilis]|uniref:ubiquitin-conjugating enzyme/RWD-like protein n=1 Tax=Radiomyces spectabilis TaxID=64574 RepID=UPI00221F37ED|nr:ubiquitin-conjugating enzyme/RWD-like protein [Radiomyces spectabilis]KAI8369542.1 ubiquitin-conjugating enzyme/RWD-like protein [Radiomyces spectabilis]